jgi:hypothetical protein
MTGWDHSSGEGGIVRSARRGSLVCLLITVSLLTACMRVNQPPAVTIQTPAAGATYAQGEAISFTGSAIDPEYGTLTGASLVWTSSLDGQIGTGGSFTRDDLSAGTHTITLTATDPRGAVGTVSVTITVSGNQVPVVTLSAPANGADFSIGVTITFTGSATDPEDGALTGISLVWTSNIEGQIGTGGSFTRDDLSAGIHTITLTAADSQGSTGTQSITITVQSLTCEGCFVTSIPQTDGLVWVPIQVPACCQGGFCRVFVSWEPDEGETAPALGALNPGLFWPVEIYQREDGTWLSGPALNIAGAYVTAGQGTNGDNNEEAVVGGGASISGNYFTLLDDSNEAGENDPDLWTFKLYNDPLTGEETKFKNMKVYVCPGGEVVPASLSVLVESLQEHAEYKTWFFPTER